MITSERAFTLRGVLAKVLGLDGALAVSTDHQIEIHGKTACQRALDNPHEYWEAIRTDEATKNWIDRRVKVYNDYIYLIVAAYTVTDPHCKASSSYEHTIDSTGRSIDGILPDLEASVHDKLKESQQRSFDAVGEMAYAVQCQRLRTKRFGIFKEADAGNIELEKLPQWYSFKKLYLVNPRRGDDDDEIPVKIMIPQGTAVEADLDDGDNWDLVKANEDVAEWDKVIVGEEEYFFPNDEERKMALVKMRKENRGSKL